MDLVAHFLGLLLSPQLSLPGMRGTYRYSFIFTIFMKDPAKTEVMAKAKEGNSSDGKKGSGEFQYELKVSTGTT
jgi:hypothetical protein